MKYSSKMDTVSIPDIFGSLSQNAPMSILSIEQNFDDKVTEATQCIINSGHRIILLTGPSSSGKTTTCEMIADKLCEMGKKTTIISLDNFYKPREQLPLWPDGSRNFETIDGLDVDYFKDRISELLANGYSDFPVFSFKLNKRIHSDRIVFDSNTFLIIEGIHALNPLLYDFIGSDETYKIYISVHSDFVNTHGEIILPARQLRLIRRLLRDVEFRGISIDETFSMWEKVCKGEDLYIRPYRFNADFHINSTHDYEPFLYYTATRSAVSHISKDSEHFEYYRQLMIQTEPFFHIGKDLIPETSLIVREFLG